MDRALKEADLPLQICMGLPNDALFSVELEAVTTFRASQDDSAKYSPQVMELGRVLMLYMHIRIGVFEAAIQTLPRLVFSGSMGHWGVVTATRRTRTSALLRRNVDCVSHPPKRQQLRTDDDMVQQY
jgi:hypothetical protein